MKILTTFLSFLLATSSFLSQLSEEFLSISDPEYPAIHNDRPIPTVKGVIKNLDADQYKEIKIVYTLVTPYAETQTKKTTKVKADGTFELDLDDAFPYQQIWLSVGEGFYAGVYAHSELIIELDGEKLMATADAIKYNGEGVKYLGNDGEVNNYLNDHILFERQQKLALYRALQEINFDRSLSAEAYLSKHDSLYEIFNNLDQEYITNNPSKYSALIHNERKSNYYGDITSRFWGKRMPKDIFNKIKDHRVFLVTNNSMILNSYLTTYLSILTRQNWEKDYRALKEYSTLNKEDRALINEFIVLNDLKEESKAYDDVQYKTLSNETRKMLNDTIKTIETKMLLENIDLLFPQVKADLLKLQISSPDINEREIILEQVLRSVKTEWISKKVKQIYRETSDKLSEINSALSRAENIKAKFPLGEALEELPFGAKLYKVDAMDHLTLLSNIKSAHSGKAIILDFWATWCGACLQEMPHSVQLQNEAKDLPVEFVYLCTSANSSLEKWKTKIAEYEISGTHIFVERTIESDLMNKFSFSGFPSYAFIDKEGNYQPGAMDYISNLDLEKLSVLLE